MPEGTQTNAQTQQQGGWFAAFSRIIMMYMIFNFMFGRSNTPQKDATGKVLPPLVNAWKPGERFVILTQKLTHRIYVYMYQSLAILQSLKEVR